MQCSNCGIELGEGPVMCPICGVSQQVNTSASGTAVINPQSQAVTGESLSREVWTAIRIILAVAFAVFVTSRRYSLSAESFGFSLGTLFLPFIIAYAVTRKERGWVRFSYWFLALAFFFSISSLSSLPKGLSSLSKPDLLKELAGTKPLESNLSEADRENAVVARSVFSELQAFNKSQDEQVNQILAVDEETSSALNQMPDLVKRHLARSSLSEIQKENFLNGFLGSYNKSKALEAERLMGVAAHNWVTATIDLYTYASQHRGEIIVIGDHIVIKNRPIRGQFNAKLARAEKFGRDFGAASTNFDAVRTEGFKQMGVTATDLGFSP